ncbi:MAG: PEP/pyruvate-binding domain-containing protein [Acidithiobacillales bacterium]
MGSIWRRVTGKRRPEETVAAVRRRIEGLRDLVEKNNEVLELIAKAGELLGGEYVFDRNTLATLAQELETATRAVVFNLNAITGDRYPELVDALKRADASVRATLESRPFVPEADVVVPLEDVGEELVDAVGEKMARLGSLKKLEECHVPEGFVVTAYASQLLLERAGVGPVIERWRGGSPAEREAGLDTLSGELRARLRAAELPKELSRAVRKALEDLRRKVGDGAFAVRSSAIGEDGELSFAGQYETRLGVPAGDVLDAYREVVASLFAAGVMRYRLNAGLDAAHGLMAVGCLAMVPARASGVVNTLDPADPSRRILQISAARGLGRAVVEGSHAVDRFEVSREAPHGVLFRALAEREEFFAVGRSGSVEKAAIPTAERSLPSVSDEELETLAGTALRIERFMKAAQDIEWAIDEKGRLFVVQSRPLRLAAAVPEGSRDLAGIEQRYPVLMKSCGVVACRGVGTGPVHVVTGTEELDAVPSGVVLVARTSSPRLAAAVAQAAAVITDIGTPTSHLAAIAREFRVPAIVDAGNATQVLRGAGEVTVDAEENVVYAGCVHELLDEQLLRRATFSDTPEFRLLRRMLRKIAPLNLKNPRGPNFFPRNCQTYHDIIRFAHEKAMEELVEGHRLVPRPGDPSFRHLDLPVPLDLLVIDLGGGVRPSDAPGPLGADQVASRPLQAVIEGLATQGVWATGPADMDLDGFMSSMTRSEALTDQMGMRPDLNVAIVATDYLNLSLRLGYHFNIVESFLSESRNDNYIYFRFTGGVTEMTRRARRATLLRRILAEHDFIVEGSGDLVIGRVKKIPFEGMVERLRMIGRLIGYTRQLDILLRDDRSVERFVRCFLDGKYDVVSGWDEEDARRRGRTR